MGITLYACVESHIVPQVSIRPCLSSAWLCACYIKGMENPRILDPERGQRDVVCVRCGADSEWIFVDSEKTRVEITCPDCGKFEMLRTEFDHAESEIVEPRERD